MQFVSYPLACSDMSYRTTSLLIFFDPKINDKLPGCREGFFYFRSIYSFVSEGVKVYAHTQKALSDCLRFLLTSVAQTSGGAHEAAFGSSPRGTPAARPPPPPTLLRPVLLPINEKRPPSLPTQSNKRILFSSFLLFNGDIIHRP